MGGMRERTLLGAVALLHRLRDQTANRVGRSLGNRSGGITPGPIKTAPWHRVFLSHSADLSVIGSEYCPEDPDILLAAGERAQCHGAGDPRDVTIRLVEDLHPGIPKGESQRAGERGVAIARGADDWFKHETKRRGG